MNVRLYGCLADLLGKQVTLDVPSSRSIAEVRAAIIARYPEVEEQMRSGRVRACVDDVIVGEEYVVQGAHAVEFLPPVSGG